jgi:hypothetical protein
VAGRNPEGSASVFDLLLLLTLSSRNPRPSRIDLRDLLFPFAEFFQARIERGNLVVTYRCGSIRAVVMSTIKMIPTKRCIARPKLSFSALFTHTLVSHGG